ncbi:MAG: response regulator [Patescibacteria group bacterium]
MENKQISILFVDDDKFLLDMYIIKFSKNNFDVHTAQDGETALKIIRDGFEPDVILIDVVIPGLNGIELLTTLRNENLIKKTVVIMLTNQGLPDDIAKAKKLNADGYIIKATTVPSEVMAEVIKIYNSQKNIKV